MHQYEDLSLNLIGAGGTEDDVLLIAYVDEILREVAIAVASPMNEAKKAGSVTVKLTIKPLENGSVVIASDVKATAPHRHIKSLMADVTKDGEVLAQDHRQEPLRFRTVRVIETDDEPKIQ
jgi:hypothetical protein